MAKYMYIHIYTVTDTDKFTINDYIIMFTFECFRSKDVSLTYTSTPNNFADVIKCCFVLLTKCSTINFALELELEFPSRCLFKIDFISKIFWLHYVQSKIKK